MSTDILFIVRGGVILFPAFLIFKKKFIEV